MLRFLCAVFGGVRKYLRKPVYDRQPYTRENLLRAMELACVDIPAEAFQGWIRHSRAFFPWCLARDNILSLSQGSKMLSKPKLPCHTLEKINYCAKTKSLRDATRRRMRNILEAEMTETHGVRVMYAQGIVALSPYLEDPYSQHGYERSVSVCKSPKIGGPGHGRSRPLTTQTVLSDEDVRAAIALLRHSADEDIREKMKATFIYRHSMVNDEKNAANVFIGLMRFLDTPGLIEQDFRLLFCEVTASKSLERWPINLKAKVVKESHGLVSTSELLELMCNAESGTEVENGMIVTHFICHCWLYR
ncbi:mitofilin [Sarotherodon galilaeus]